MPRRRRDTAGPRSRHRVEYPLYVGGRAADDLQHLAVAVCCSSASFVSLNSRTFSIAMTAWSANVSRSLICLSENGRTSGRRNMIHRWPYPRAPRVRRAPSGTRIGNPGTPHAREDRGRRVRGSSGARGCAVDEMDRAVTRRTAPSGGTGTDPICATTRDTSPSTRRTTTSLTSHNRAALSATAVSTRWISVGELEITRRISTIAVCCSSASVRRFSSSWIAGAFFPGALRASGLFRGSLTTFAGFARRPISLSLPRPAQRATTG